MIVAKERNPALLEIDTMRRYVKTITKNAGMNVVFDESVPAPCTDGRTIRIPEVNSGVTHRDLLTLRGFVLHETLHTTKGAYLWDITNPMKLPPEDPLRALINIYEDIRIEREGAKDYRGDATILSEAFKNTIERNTPEWLEAAKKVDNKVGVGIFAALGTAIKARSEWCYGALETEKPLIEGFPKNIQEAMAKLESEGLLDALKNMSGNIIQGPEDAVKAAKRTFELLFDKDPEQHIREQQAKAQAVEEEGDGEGEKQKGRGKAQEIEEEGEGEGYEDLAEVEYTKIELSDHMHITEGGVKLDYTNYSLGDMPVPQEFDTMHVVNFITGEETHSGLLSQMNVSSRKEYSILKMRRYYDTHGTNDNFGNEIRRHLQVASENKYRGGQKKGKIHNKNLYRIGMREAQGFNERVFKQKTVSDMLDTAVLVLVDNSGSMNGAYKWESATDSAVLLNESISRALHIPVSIVGFSHDDGTYLGIIKEFDINIDDNSIIENMSSFTAVMGDNNDGDALLYCYDMLKKRREKRKILICLSDGSPAASGWGDEVQHLKMVAKTIEEEGHVELYGIGIIHENVSEFYSHSEVISDVGELKHTLLSVIKKYILK